MEYLDEDYSSWHFLRMIVPVVYRVSIERVEF
jgi:hypothetical protein